MADPKILQAMAPGPSGPATSIGIGAARRVDEQDVLKSVGGSVDNEFT
jgi:hypothetical protein